MLGLSVSNMGQPVDADTQPPVGSKPTSRAARKSSSTPWASSRGEPALLLGLQPPALVEGIDQLAEGVGPFRARR